nr:hypothetical protein [Streptomyces tsukubensis NRRL18488]
MERIGAGARAVLGAVGYEEEFARGRDRGPEAVAALSGAGSGEGSAEESRAGSGAGSESGEGPGTGVRGGGPVPGGLLDPSHN